MKATSPLAKKFSAYSIFAGAFLAAEKSDAQIIYTDVNPDDTVVAGNNFQLDLNNDGIPDFNFGISFYGTWGWRAGIGSGGYAGNQNFARGHFGGSDAYASALSTGDSICPQDNWWALSHDPLFYVDFVRFESGIFYADWQGVSDHFVGLKMLMSDGYHFAWARLSVSLDGLQMIIKDFAYNGIVNECIAAGQTIPTTISKNNSALTILVTPNPASHQISIVNLNESLWYQISIFDISGREILSQKASSTENSLDVSALAEGMYLLQLKHHPDGSGEVLVKKFAVKR